MQKEYIYERKDGGTTDCYGKLNQNSNIQLACVDEFNDTIWIPVRGVGNSWQAVCRWLERTHDNQIEEMIAC